MLSLDRQVIETYSQDLEQILHLLYHKKDSYTLLYLANTKQGIMMNSFLECTTKYISEFEMVKAIQDLDKTLHEDLLAKFARHIRILRLSLAKDLELLIKM